MGGQLQKLPLSVVDWLAFSRCCQGLSSAVFSSVSSLLESSSSSSSIDNDWEVGVGLSGVGNLQLAGSQSAEFRVPNVPPLSPEFHRHVESLPPEYSRDTAYLYRRFINTYGTLHPTGYNLGFLNTFTEVLGGNGWPGLFSMTRNDSAGYRRWLASIRESPEIVSYSLLPVHELVSDTTVQRHLQDEVRKYILSNGLARRPKPPGCGWNRPNLSPDCCPLHTHRGRLRVTVLRAWGLKGNPVGRTEGYVKLWYGGSYRQTGCIRSKYPIWNSHFDLCTRGSGSGLRPGTKT
ncbi:hypothetical protein ACEWY4_000367 [Coilia grayii]|uniref:MACPF domain-containing protein n=1 Tax=Coilia grayii TaxID=363190 RepID=A0ABD1KWG3_9TELE